jgi:hypothetical protein
MQDYTFVTQTLITLKKKKTKQCRREFRYHQKKLTQCSKFQHPEVISLNQHCKIQTRNFYRNWPSQNNSQRRTWKRTEVAHMQTLPKSEKWVHCLSRWRFRICRSTDHHREGLVILILYEQERNWSRYIHEKSVGWSRCMHEKSVGV